jgi:hypothetical protein
VRFFFWPLVLAYSVVGIADLFIDYYHGTVFNLAALPGQLAATYTKSR